MTAWIHGLDPKKRGKLEEEDFCHRVKEMGFEGDVKKLWQLLLAEPHRKYIVLRDIDPAAAAAFFRGDDKSLTLYGTQSGPQASPSKWTGKISVINTEENEDPVSPAVSDGPVTPPSPGSPGKTLTLPGTPSKRRPASHASSRAPSNASVARSQSGLDEDSAVYRPTRIAIWSEELGTRKRAEAELRAKTEMDMQVGPKSLDDYRRQLINISGSLAGAWRNRIDPECTGRQSFMQFVMAIERTGGYSGSVKQLWEEISGDKDEFTFQDLDPEGFEILQAFGTSLLNSYDTFGDFWKSLLKFKDEQLDEESFISRSVESGIDGLSRRELKRIFKMFLPEPSTGRTKLIQSDLEVIVIALNIEQKAALRHSTTQKSLELDSPKSPRPTSPMPASPKGLAVPGSPTSPGSRSPSRASSRVRSSPELPVISVEEFRRLLKRLYGSVHAGWVKYLDVTEAGRVPKGEFVNRARAIGVTGHVAELFAAFDVDNKGFITLKDLDPSVSKVMKAFFRCVEESYGCIEEAWKKAFDVSKRRVVGKAEFAKGCEAIGYEGDAMKLFALLQPETGRTFLELADLGRHAAESVKAHEDG